MLNSFAIIVTPIVTKTTVWVFKPEITTFQGTLEDTYKKYKDTNGQLLSCNWLEHYQDIS